VNTKSNIGIEFNWVDLIDLINGIDFKLWNSFAGRPQLFYLGFEINFLTPGHQVGIRSKWRMKIDWWI
jgi:hypothetical protein